ncbi:MAG: hypothetical protein DRP89_08385, partial [Candidatus Neomarinimicrobiota bacterium]
MDSLKRKKKLIHQEKNISGLENRSKISKSVDDNHDFLTIKDYTTTITILENISDAIFILDTEGRIKYANMGALDLLKIEFDALIGRFVDEILIDNFDTSGSISLRTNNNTNKNHKLTEKFRKGIFGNIEASMINNEHIVPVILNFSVVKDNSNEISYIIVTAKDISQLKALEKKLKRQQALAISRDRLRSLGELYVGLVHELSQPLSALTFRVEQMISLSTKNDEQEENLREMMASINRISDTIQHMRSYAHQTEDETLKIININKLVENASNLINYELRKNNIEVIIKKGNHLPYVLSNQSTLEQVFVNFLTNSRDAFKSMEQKGKIKENYKKKIEIITKAIDDKWVEISVEDNAGGIDENIKNEIFEPFFTTKEPETNSGVGLSICKSIITSLGGDIKVEIKKEIGSKFIVRIPLVQN